jgi:hypothetical protein
MEQWSGEGSGQGGEGVLQGEEKEDNSVHGGLAGASASIRKARRESVRGGRFGAASERPRRRGRRVGETSALGVSERQVRWHGGQVSTSS